MIKKSLIWSYRVAYIALGTFVFLGLLSIIGLRYFVLPHIDDYKPKIVQGLSQILGQKVTIGNIYANWDNLNPHLSVFNFDIYDKENRIALSLRHIEGSHASRLFRSTNPSSRSAVKKTVRFTWPGCRWADHPNLNSLTGYCVKLK